MTPAEIAENAIKKINKKITDIVFLEIQNDKDLMRPYLRCVETNGLNSTNQQIGKAVKKHYHLVDADERNDDPKSTLIDSHQKFLS